MSKYHASPIRRIEDALNTPTNMLIRVLAPLHGVWAELQPEVGKIYPAVRGTFGTTGRIPRKGRPFCYVKIKDHIVVLRGEAGGDTIVEYEEVPMNG